MTHIKNTNTPSQFEMKEILPKVFYFAFDQQRDLTMSMCRMQEFYESSIPHIRGQYFDWPTFLDTFSDEKGEIKYFHFWSGFNIPGVSLQDFKKLFGHDLSPREKTLFNTLEKQVDFNDKFYIIASRAEKLSVLEHEVAHALYYVNPAYKVEMDAITQTLPDSFKTPFVATLVKMGYSDQVANDEIQAYLSTSDAPYLKERFNTTGSEVQAQMDAMVQVFNKYRHGEAKMEPTKKKALAH